MLRCISHRHFIFATLIAAICQINFQSALAQELTDRHQSADQMAARVHSAEEIIGSCRIFEAKAAAFHARAESLIAQANQLQGEAQVLTTRTPNLPLPTRMSDREYRLGSQQYDQDRQVFALHAAAYKQHLKQFQDSVGECHANEKVLDGVLKKYEIHASEFHGANAIRPPHICGTLRNMVDRDWNQVAHSMLNDQMRVLQVEHTLSVQEAALHNAEQVNSVIGVKAVNQSQREEREQALLAEFGRLKEESDLLHMEKQRLTDSHADLGKVSHSSISAKLQGR